MTATATTISGILKQLYPQDKVEYLLYKDHPLLGMIPKSTDFGGNDVKVSLLYAPTAGRSKTFARAQANKTGARYSPFTVTRVKDYSLFSLETEAILASKNDKYSLINAVKSEGDSAFCSIENSMAWDLYRNGGGVRGQISAINAATVTLTSPEDIVAFEVGYVFVADDEPGTGTLDNPTDRATVTAVDVDAGTVTFDALPASFGVNDYLFMDGDYGLGLSGIDAWLPATVTATPFFGVNRSVHPTRLGGQRFTLTQADHSTLTRGFTIVASRMKREGSKADCIMMNPLDWAKFVNEQVDRTKLEREVYAMGSKGKKLEIGYPAIGFACAMGVLDVIPDPDCPQGIAYVLQKNTWKFQTLEEAPRWLDDDGNKMLREGSSDALEGRLGYYGNVWCKAPGWNARVDISNIVNNA